MNDQTTLSPDQRSAPSRDGMVWVPGGEFLMGSDKHYPEEAPSHRVRVDGFWMDRFTVTNRDFQRFVEATGHVTLAERPADPKNYPGARAEMLAPSSTMFRKPAAPVDIGNHYNWWVYVPGASWRHPRGPASSIKKLMDHPVVHVAWEDVEAYAAWAGKQLPTEAEWEFAARGGLDAAEFAWGAELTPQGRHMANTWQGNFPAVNEARDGYLRTSPVKAFPPNGYGLYDMIGNVWEWTADWFSPRHETTSQGCCRPSSHRGEREAGSYDPDQPEIRIPRKVLKGGSHLCAPNYCRRYRPAARHAEAIDTSTCHIGFRCVIRSGGTNEIF